MEKEKRNRIIIAVGAGVAIVISLIIIILLVVKGNKKEEVKPQEAGNETEYAEGEIDMNNTENAEIKDAVKHNTSTKVQEEKMYNDMKITDAVIFSSQYTSQFSATIKNELEKPVEGEAVNIVFVRQDGSEIARAETFFPNMEPQSENVLNASSNLDIANSYDFYIERAK